MHIPTPHLGKRSEKRKASITEPVEADNPAVIDDEPVATTHHTATDDIPHPIKLHKPKPKPKKAKREPKVKTKKVRATSEEVKDPHPQPDSDLDFDLPPPTTEPTPLHNPDMIAAMQRSRSPTQDPTDDQTNTNTPRRSSRIKDSMNKIGTSWHKVRPYVERINGTIMPLQHQGTTAYYNRDGIKLDQRPTAEGEARMGGAA